MTGLPTLDSVVVFCRSSEGESAKGCNSSRRNMLPQERRRLQPEGNSMKSLSGPIVLVCGLLASVFGPSSTQACLFPSYYSNYTPTYAVGYGYSSYYAPSYASYPTYSAYYGASECCGVSYSVPSACDTCGVCRCGCLCGKR